MNTSILAIEKLAWSMLKLVSMTFPPSEPLEYFVEVFLKEHGRSELSLVLKKAGGNKRSSGVPQVAQITAIYKKVVSIQRAPNM